MRRAKLFVRDENDFEKYRVRLKLLPCPHCRRVGFLICHGSLYGHPEEGNGEVTRGRRIYCSKRGLRGGCGHTYSMLWADCLPRRYIRASRMERLFQCLKEGFDFKTAWETVRGRFFPEYGLRIGRALQRAKPRIRILLCRLQPPPSLKDICPLRQTIQHLWAAFPKARCPVAAFQLHFQEPFLG